MKKYVSILIICVILIASLLGCNNAETDNVLDDTLETIKKQENTVSSDETDSQNETASQDKTAEISESLGFDVTWEDVAEINVVYLATGSIPVGLQEVEDAINDIIEPLINTRVHLNVIEVGNYAQQVSLMMSSNEQVDLLMTSPGGSATFAAMQSQGQLTDITDLLAEYGQAVLDTVGEFSKATTINGRLYGVPSYRLYAGSLYAVMRTDVLDDLGLTEQAENIQTLRDLEVILEAVHSSDKWGNLAGLAPAGGDGHIAFVTETFAGIDTPEDTIFDGLSDRQLFMIKASDSSATIQLTPASEEFRAEYELIHSWYEKGYIYTDSATSTERASDLIKADKCFACLTGSEIGVEASYAASCQQPVTCVELSKRFMATRNGTQFTWVVPTTAKEAEAAVAFMSVLYTSPEINNLLAWGIEGRDYIVEDGIAQYPGDTSDVPYHSADFIIGNQFLVTPWSGSDADLREQAQKAMDEATASPYLGFTCDSSNVTTELSAINNVVEEYRKQILSGVAEPEVLDEYIAKLESVGIQKVLDEYQRQLDEWLENN